MTDTFDVTSLTSLFQASRLYNFQCNAVHRLQIDIVVSMSLST